MNLRICHLATRLELSSSECVDNRSYMSGIYWVVVYTPRMLVSTSLVIRTTALSIIVQVQYHI